jgi:hypothetical protein
VREWHGPGWYKYDKVNERQQGKKTEWRNMLWQWRWEGVALSALNLLDELLLLLEGLLASNTALDTGETLRESGHATTVEVHADSVCRRETVSGSSARREEERRTGNNDSEADTGNEVGKVGGLEVGDGTLDGREDGSTSDTPVWEDKSQNSTKSRESEGGDVHAEKTGSALRVLAEVGRREGEDGRVDDRLSDCRRRVSAPSNDNEKRETDRRWGTSRPAWSCRWCWW